MKYGSVADSSYPLRLFLGHGRCLEVGMDIVATIDGYQGNPPIERDLMRAVSKQFVAVMVYSCPAELRARYKGGSIEFEDWPVLDGEADRPRHALLLVGYGKDEKGNLFWKVMNSYGPLWEDRGFAYLQRGVKDKLGVAGITWWLSISPIII